MFNYTAVENTGTLIRYRMKRLGGVSVCLTHMLCVVEKQFEGANNVIHVIISLLLTGSEIIRELILYVWNPIYSYKFVNLNFISAHCNSLPPSCWNMLVPFHRSAVRKKGTCITIALDSPLPPTSSIQRVCTYLSAYIYVDRTWYSLITFTNFICAKFLQTEFAFHLLVWRTEFRSDITEYIISINCPVSLESHRLQDR